MLLINFLFFSYFCYYYSMIEAASHAQLSVQRFYADPIIILIHHTVDLIIITAFTRQMLKQHAKDSVHVEVIGLSNFNFLSLIILLFLFTFRNSIYSINISSHETSTPSAKVFLLKRKEKIKIYFHFFSFGETESNEIKKQNRLNERQKPYQMKYKTTIDKKSDEINGKVRKLLNMGV